MVLVFIVFITLAISIFMFANSLKKSGANKIVVEILYWIAGAIIFSTLMVLFFGMD